MQYKTLTKKTHKVTPSEIKAFRRLSFPYGALYPAFCFNRYDIRSRVAIIKVNKKIVAWGLLFYIDDDEYDIDLNAPTIQLYVANKYRRQGLGTKIINALKRFEKKRRIGVCPHSEQSDAFLKKFLKTKKFKCAYGFELGEEDY